MATVEAPVGSQTRLHEGPFVNEPMVDFSKEENVRKMRSAIEKVRGQLGREYDLIIGGRRVKTQEKIKSLNPARPTQVVGVHQKAGKEHVELAMEAAQGAFHSWAEADGDIAELIDFCEFYSREALRLSRVTAPVQLPGERDHLFYIPLGVGAVIPPWNFPAAIMGGMTLASIVCGNAVVLKPSSDSPTIAAKFVELL